MRERLARVDGWTFALLLLATLCFVGAASAREWVPEQQRVATWSFFALALGYGLGLLPVSKRLGGLGLLLSGLVVGGLAFGDLAQIAAWGRQVLSGNVRPSSQVTLAVVAWASWMAAAYAGWAIQRNTSAVKAMLPMGTLTALAVYYAFDIGLLYFIGFLFCVTVLMARTEILRRAAVWEASRIGYASDLLTDVSFNVALLGLVLFTVSLVASASAAVLPDVSDPLWQVVGGPIRGIGKTFEQLFGNLVSQGVSDRDRENVAGGNLFTPLVAGLPRSHLLRGAPALHRQIIAYVRTDDPPPLDYDSLDEAPREEVKRYWRAGVYDAFDGRGWSSTYDQERPVIADELLRASRVRQYQVVTQQYDPVFPGEVVLAVNSPAQVSSGNDVLLGQWRGGELFGLRSPEPFSTTYEVVSYAPNPTADQLREAGESYPDWIRATYLALPPVSDRVTALAAEIAGDAPTPYEIALRLEQYLRTLPYSLEAPPPPPGRDVVAFFLFDAGVGYCDYYTSAFVVMARSLGVPARMAVGYTTGDYDDLRGAFIVRGDDAHSWPEVYFPGYGWIEFEPTPAFALFDRVSETDNSASALPTLAIPQKKERIRHFSQYVLIIGGAIFFGAAVIGGWLLARQRRSAALSTPEFIADVYRRLGQGGGRVGLPPHASQTPAEYAGALAQFLHERADRSRRWRQRWLRQAQVAGESAVKLSALYTQMRYSQDNLTDSERRSAQKSWQSARLRLWAFVLKRLPFA